MQKDVANFFARGSAARFPGDGDGEAVGAQGPRQFLDLSALAAPVETFKGYKLSACGHVGMIAGDGGWREHSGSGRSAADRAGRFRSLQADILTHGSICMVAGRLINLEGEWAQVVE